MCLAAVPDLPQQPPRIVQTSCTHRYRSDIRTALLFIEVLTLALALTNSSLPPCEVHRSSCACAPSRRPIHQSEASMWNCILAQRWTVTKERSLVSCVGQLPEILAALCKQHAGQGTVLNTSRAQTSHCFQSDTSSRFWLRGTAW